MGLFNHSQKLKINNNSTFTKKIIVPVYYGCIVLLYVGYILNAFEIKIISPHFLYYLRQTLQVFLAIFLIVRFGPWHMTHEITQGDTGIIYASAIFLFINICIETYIDNYHLMPNNDFITKFIQSYLSPAQKHLVGFGTPIS
jgi:hypothetical protein